MDGAPLPATSAEAGRPSAGRVGGEGTRRRQCPVSHVGTVSDRWRIEITAVAPLAAEYRRVVRRRWAYRAATVSRVSQNGDVRAHGPNRSPSEYASISVHCRNARCDDAGAELRCSAASPDASEVCKVGVRLLSGPRDRRHCEQRPTSMSYSGARPGALRGFLPDTATPRGSLRPTRRSTGPPSAPALPGSGQPVPGAGGTPSDHTAHQPVDRDAGRVLAVGPWRRG